MLKNLTIKSLLAICLLAAGFNSAFSQAAFWSETFASDAAFQAWTNANTGAGAVKWTRETDPAINMGFNAAPTPFTGTTAADGYAFYNSDLNGQNNIHDATLTFGPIDCASHTHVGIRFNSQFADFQGSDVEVRVSVNGGTSWTAYPIFDDQPSYGIGQNTLVPGNIATDLELPAAGGQATVWIQFRWSGDWEYGWKLDDVELYEFVPAKVPVTFKVNLSQATVDPAGAKIAGSFTNWADADMTDEGNGVWSYTTDLDAGSEALYKFKNGPNGWENVTAACGEPDGFGGFNRKLTVPATATTLAAVCLNSCDPCVVGCEQNPDKIICDNFDGYNPAQKLGPQATWWTTWSGVEGGNEDGIVSTEQASTAPHALKVSSTAPNGGPQDVVLDLGDKTSGHYSLAWSFYVPTGKHGYYNIQDVVPIPASPVTENWNMDVFFEDNGKGRAVVEGADIFAFDYPQGAWFSINHDVDLDNNILKFYINGAYAGSIPYPDQLGGIDFYGTDAVSTFYVDNVEYIKLPDVVYNVDVCDAAVDLAPYFGGAPGVPSTTGIQNNTTATVAATDPAANSLCFGDLVNGQTPAPKLDGTMWYTFGGDGKRYHIETVPCNATNYIGTGQDDPGDTQMAIFSGSDCANLTLVACNDDESSTGQPDWRSALDIETTAGTNYYMMIDGFNFNNVVAIGEFCIEITQQPSVDCSQAAVGAAQAASAYLCFGETTAFELDETNTVIPTVGPIYGLSWAISSAPIPAGTYPPDAPGYIAGFGVSQTPFTPSLANDASVAFLPPGQQFFFTPVVVGGGVNTTGNPNFLHNVDVTGGCYSVGQSISVFFMPDPSELEPIQGNIVSTVGPNGVTFNLTPGGGLGEYLGDESFYTYEWSNGATTQDITVTSGSYTVTVSDISGCPDIDPWVSQILSDAKDPLFVESITLSPNPTREAVTLQMSLEKAVNVRVEIVNSIGQSLQTLDFGKVANLNQRLQLGGYADGVYFIRLNLDGEKTQRSFVISH